MSKNARSQTGFLRFSMYACINCQNRSFVGIAVGAAGRVGGVGIGVSGVGEADAGTSRAGVALQPIDGEAEVFALEEVELLERKDLLKLLADSLEPLAASLLATLWAAAFCREVQWRDGAIGAKKKKQ